MKLTKIHPSWKYLAMDYDGDWYFRIGKPSMISNCIWERSKKGYGIIGCPFDVPFSGDWKDSLHRRNGDEWEVVG